MSEDLTVTREVLVNRLVENHGLTIRKARAVVKVILDSIREALQRGEVVDLPFGTFEVVERTERPPQRGWFLNRVRVIYKQRKTIRFTPKDL